VDVKNLRSTGLFDISGHPILKLTEEIKRARSTMLRLHGPNAYVYYHRQIGVDHTESQSCICDPVVIGQNDHRPSVYFANEILNPVWY
jgi:hypothetical protein